MEKELNIAAILKDKPNAKLWSPIVGNCTFKGFSSKNGAIVASFVDKDGELLDWDFNEYGKTFSAPKEAEVCLFPSKSMRVWSKFAWKKGDVLVHKDGDVHIVFERFVDDTYCSFVGKYYLWKENNNTEQFYENERLLTSDFQKAGKDAAQTYINTIEERLGGKLNRETLEIEKQPEFKDGDFVCYTSLDGDKCIGIVKEIKNDAIMFHVDYNLGKNIVDFNVPIFKEIFKFYKSNDLDDEIALNEALYSRYKSWNKEKNILEELKPKVELKPFDKVLVRDSESDKWRANLFGYISEDGYYYCVFASWVYCIPYIGNESLLGTTKDVEGKV